MHAKFGREMSIEYYHHQANELWLNSMKSICAYKVFGFEFQLQVSE